jgi:hypothetical protein
MLVHPTVERLRALGLASMSDALMNRTTIVRQPRCRTPERDIAFGKSTHLKFK